MDESTRNKIKNEILFGLPNHTYLQFVKSHFTPQSKNDYAQSLPIDPFASRLTSNHISTLYIPRESVEQEINTLGSKIIQGRNGIGKTALIQQWLQEPLSSNQTLYVLTHLHTPVDAESLLAGKESLLSPSILIFQIFDSFWNHLICNEDQRILLVKLRSNQNWMETLRWYYQHFTPIHATSHPYFALKSWLNEKPTEHRFPETSAPEDILRELILFITNQNDSIIPQFTQRIRILIDSTIHQNSPKAINRIIIDADHLHGLNIPNLEFTLFFDSDSLLKKIATMTCISRGEVPYYPLPVWTKEKLHELLSTRIMTRFPDGDKYDVSTHAKREFIGRRIDPDYLDVAARSLFTKIILESFPTQALHLPIHALKLARIFCATATGSWPMAAPCKLPLKIKNLEEIAELYWFIIQEER